MDGSVPPSIPPGFLTQVWQLTTCSVSEVLILVEAYSPHRLLWSNQDEGIGLPIRECFSRPQGQRIEEILRQVAVRGQPCTIDEYEIKGLPTGSKYGLPEDATYWSIRAYPLRDREGRVSAVYGIATDVTATKVAPHVAEQARERARLQAILDAVPSGVLVAEGKERRVTLLNRRAFDLFGRALQADMPLPHAWQLKLYDLNGALLSPEQMPASIAVEQGEPVHGVQVVLERPDGERVVVHANAAPLYDEEGKIYGAVGTFEDITALKEAERHLEEMQNELRKAYAKEHNISETLQQAMLPPIPQHLEGVTSAHEYHPAYEEAHVGGDFFDMFCPRSGLIGMVIGDVSGKGVQAAVRTAQAKYSLRAFASENPEPASVVDRLNSLLVAESDLDGFVTLFYGVLDTSKRTLCYVNAGHEPPLLLTCSDCALRELTSGGMALGIMPDATYAQHTVSLGGGDRVLLYTDGVTDARNRDGFLTVDGLKTIFLSEGLEPPHDFTGHLMRHIEEWSEGHLADDAAVLLICPD